MRQRRDKTVPPTQAASRSPRSVRKELIAKEKTEKQSARRGSVLDNRFHRTDQHSPPLNRTGQHSKPRLTRRGSTSGAAQSWATTLLSG